MKHWCETRSRRNVDWATSIGLLLLATLSLQFHVYYIKIVTLIGYITSLMVMMTDEKKEDRRTKKEERSRKEKERRKKQKGRRKKTKKEERRRKQGKKGARRAKKEGSHDSMKHIV